MGRADVEARRASTSQRRVDRGECQGPHPETCDEHHPRYGKRQVLYRVYSCDMVCSWRVVSAPKPLYRK
jgi:hypothetical protein